MASRSPSSGRLALDVGASTGGFTQVLLERGAASRHRARRRPRPASPAIAAEPAVTVIEGFNARAMTADDARDAAGTAEVPELVVADLSFISLRTVLPAVAATVGDEADYVVLVKPQFEVGRTGIREGVVRDPALREEAVNDVLWAAWDLGLPTAGLIAVPAGRHQGKPRISGLVERHAGQQSDTMERPRAFLRGIRPRLKE